MLQTISEAFAGMNEHAPIIVCGALVLMAGLFVAVMLIDNRQRKVDKQTIRELELGLLRMDEVNKDLLARLKREQSRSFAARTDCKRECAKRDKKIAQLENKVNQLIKWNEQK